MSSNSGPSCPLLGQCPKDHPTPLHSLALSREVPLAPRLPQMPTAPPTCRAGTERMGACSLQWRGFRLGALICSDNKLHIH